MRLAWDRNAASIPNFDHAILHINDGMHHSNLNLNAAEMDAGKLVYWPETDDVTFRLEAVAPTGVTSATIHVPSLPFPAAEHVEKPAADPPVERKFAARKIVAYSKPSPFAPPKAPPSAQETSVAAVADDVALESQVSPAAEPPALPAAKPAGSFFGRLAHKIPLVRRFHSSAHRRPAGPD